MQIMAVKGMLDSIRVLDLTDDKGLLCSRILADIGADVIKIERPGGDDSRAIGPFFQDIPDSEKSLFWFFCNLNKRSITLDFTTSDGKEIFQKLVRKADIVIESFAPGYMDSLGLGYSSLSELNSGIIVTSISPFGANGPYKDRAASDLTLMGMSGWLYLSGEPDRPPVRISAPQAYLCGAAEAAAQTMVALSYRDMTQEGQWVDVSIQQSIIPNTLQAIPLWEMENVILERAGAFRVGLGSGARQRQTWPCKGGFVNFVIYGGLGGAKARKGIVKLMGEQRYPSDYLKEVSFDDPLWDVADLRQEDWDKIEDPIGKFFLERTKEWLLKEGMKFKCPIVPVAAPSDLLDYEQLKARSFWIGVEHPELGTSITYPGYWGNFSETPCMQPRRAPLIGEHNLEIYKTEVGLSDEEIVALKQARVI